MIELIQLAHFKLSEDMFLNNLLLIHDIKVYKLIVSTRMNILCQVS